MKALVTKNLSIGWILRSIGLFLAIIVVFAVLPGDVATLVLPFILFASFAFAVIKAPPVAIAILLYYSMILGSWLILAAAPVAILLARRYQRHRMLLDVNPDHIRRTSLFAMAALVATLPFLELSLGPWSSRGDSSSFDSARPLIEQARPGEEGALQRFARWLGFGPDTDQFNQGPLVPGPVRPLQQDEPFNWWIVVLIVLIVAMLGLAWWLWRRINAQVVEDSMPTAADPLARLEAIGASIGRPRRPFEGAITYGQVLAEQTGDSRLAQTGPLVSSQVYESAFVNPGEVSQSLSGIESAPPPAPPRPPLSERLREQARSISVSAQAIAAAVLAAALIAAAIFIVLPRLGDLESDRFESGASATVASAALTPPEDNLARLH